MFWNELLPSPILSEMPRYLYPLIPLSLDGKEALKRLRKFFKKEKDRFKMKKNKLKENVR